MARKLSPGPRFSRYQPSTALFSPSSTPQKHVPHAQRPRWPQIVARRGSISASVEPVAQGYLVAWTLKRNDQIHVLYQRGPFPSRALAVCWARVVLILREEAWLAVQGVRHER